MNKREIWRLVSGLVLLALGLLFIKLGSLQHKYCHQAELINKTFKTSYTCDDMRYSHDDILDVVLPFQARCGLNRDQK